MKITEAIILCGGLGRRIASVLPNIPKVLAPVAGHPFIYFVIDHLRKQGITKIILATGHGHGLVREYITSTFPGTPPGGESIEFGFSREEKPLGTGGAIKLAFAETTTQNVLVVNGDTLYKIDLAELAAAHQGAGTLCTLALKPMHNFDRYGAVELGPDGKILSFKEKQYCAQGLVNGGVYILGENVFTGHPLPSAFSFEKNYLEPNCSAGIIAGMVQDKYFIDMGVPEDLERARLELSW
jgi:D-glycero-alpha-D-manno-heptose 1-phosphate guanylyltransferase